MTNTGYVREVSSKGVSIAAKQRVDETKELHDSLVLAQIFMTLQQELVLLPITPCTMQQGGMKTSGEGLIS